MNKKPDIIFECRKCQHLLFISKKEIVQKMYKLNKRDCPNCGEDGYRNWFFVSEGDFDKKDFGDF